MLDAPPTMKSGLSFLVAALRCEIDELDQLGRTSELVGAIGRLVHALQRERGLSNVVLASGGQRFVAEREAQVAQSLRLEQEVRRRLDRLDDARGAYRRALELVHSGPERKLLERRLAELER